MSPVSAQAPTRGHAERQVSAVPGTAETLLAGNAMEVGGRVRWERRNDGRYSETVLQRRDYELTRGRLA